MRSARTLLVLLPALLGGCAVGLGGPPLVSGQSIANAQASNTEPQPLNSLPLDAAGLPSGRLSTAPDCLAVRLGAGAGRSTY